MSDLKTKALELAIHASGSPTEVVQRATHYHTFLSGAGPAQSGKPAASATAATSATAAAKPGSGTGGKPATTAGKPATQAAKSGTNGAARPAAAAAAKNEAKSKGGNTVNDVTNMARKVIDTGVTRDAVINIMAENGGGARQVKDLKPEHYDAVIEALQQELQGEKASGSGDTDDALGFGDSTGSAAEDAAV